MLLTKMENNGNIILGRMAWKGIYVSERNNISFEIVQHFGVIARRDEGWARELNIVRWNGGSPKYDIREWDSHHERMGRGITLREGEMRRVVELFLESKSREAVSRGRQIQEDKYRRRQEQFGYSGSPGVQKEKEREADDNPLKPVEEAAGHSADAEEAESANVLESAETASSKDVNGSENGIDNAIEPDATGLEGTGAETERDPDDAEANLF